MKVNSNISNRLRNFFDKYQSTRELLPYAVAKRIAFLLPIPPSLENLQTHFRRTHEHVAVNIISKINERFYFNTKECLKATYAIWNTRCQLVYNPNSIDFLNLLVSSKIGAISPDVIRRLDIERDDANLNAISRLDEIVSMEIQDNE